MKTIEKMIKLQKEFAELYGNGLVAIESNYIQLNAEFMKEHFPVIRVSKQDENWLEMTAVKYGVKFIALVLKG